MHELCHCSQRTSKGRAHMLETEQVLNKLPDQGISHPQGRGHWIYLAITDHFATFAQAFATANKSGKTAAARLYRDFALPCKFSEKFSAALGWGNLKLGSCTPQYHIRDGQGSPPHSAEARTKKQLVSRTCGPTHPASWTDPCAAHSLGSPVQPLL